MVRKKSRAVKQSVSPPENNDVQANKIKEQRGKVAKITKSSEKKNETVSEVSHSTSMAEKNSSTRNIRKKRKYIDVFLQSQRTRSLMSKAMFNEIRYLQRSVHTVIPKLSFSRVVREIIGYFGNYRVRIDALAALQESCELYATQLFEDAYFCTLHAKRRTLYVSDIHCVRRIRGIDDVINH